MHYHGILSTTVERRDERTVESRSILLSTGCEAVALIAVEPGNFLVQAADRDFNVNRLERYLTICHAASVRPIIVFSPTLAASSAMCASVTG